MHHDSPIQKAPILKVKLQRNVLYSSVCAQHSFNIVSKERKKKQGEHGNTTIRIFLGPLTS